jgi:hypothetical protein
MLTLTDPLWQKLGSAYRKQDVAKLLSELAEAWDKEKATSLFWDELHHQGTLYGATYAAVPHLIKMAEPDGNRRQRYEIALFLGRVALCALTPDPAAPLQGLPETLEGWDRQLDAYRGLVAHIEDPKRPATAYERSELPHYRRVLALDPVDAADLEKIKAIRREFIAALPSIGTLCERALLENLDDRGEAGTYLLSGIAAAERLLDLASLMDSGREGLLRCAACDRRYEFILYGNRVAVYAEPERDLRLGYNENAMLDWEEKAPSRADGFIAPADDADAPEPRIARLLALTRGAEHSEASVLLRNFLGHIDCCKCGAHATIRAV